jgi:Sec-independent protein translocase protein TatA
MSAGREQSDKIAADQPSGELAAAELPGKGVLGWLGRQVGHVTRAVKQDVSSKNELKKVYQKIQVQEQSLPEQPEVKLRRTTIDEVVIEKKKQASASQS